MRKSTAALLVGLLISLVFAASCAGNEADQTDKQDTQRTSESTKKEDTEARAKEAKGKARPGEAMLEMNGDPGTEFSGTCTVGNDETEISGQVPDSFAYDLDGERLDCEIHNDSPGGNLEIVFATAPNNRSVQQLNRGTLNLTYENGKISSFSSSSSSSSSSSDADGEVSSSQVVSSSQSSSSSVQVSP